MSEGKPLASLSSALLARKGHAKPAMRPQAVQLGHNLGQQLEDLGWNDMGDVAPDAAVPIQFPGTKADVMDGRDAPVVHEQLEAIAREFSIPQEIVETVSPIVEREVIEANVPAKAPRAAAGSRGKAAFTLRLDPQRHLKLRLVCAVRHRSAQQIVTQALDEFLARHPDECQQSNGASK